MEDNTLQNKLVSAQEEGEKSNGQQVLVEPGSEKKPDDLNVKDNNKKRILLLGALGLIVLLIIAVVAIILINSGAQVQTGSGEGDDDASTIVGPAEDLDMYASPSFSCQPSAPDYIKCNVSLNLKREVSLSKLAFRLDFPSSSIEVEDILINNVSKDDIITRDGNSFVIAKGEEQIGQYDDIRSLEILLHIIQYNEQEPVEVDFKDVNGVFNDKTVVIGDKSFPIEYDDLYYNGDNEYYGLIDKFDDTYWNTYNIFSDGMDGEGFELFKARVAASDAKGRYECEYDSLQNLCVYNTMTYDDVNESYHNIFGSAMDVQKDVDEGGCGIPKYHEDINLYAEITNCGGLTDHTRYIITDVSENADNLKIDVDYMKCSAGGECVLVDGQTIDESTLHNYYRSNKVVDQLTEMHDSLNKTQFVFVKESGNWILSEMVSL